MKKMFFPFLFLVLLASCESITDKDSEFPDYADSELSKYGSEGGSPHSSPGDNGNEVDIKPGQITAGEWNDLVHWNYWNDLFQKERFKDLPNYWSFDLSERISIELRNQSGDLMTNYPVVLLDKDRNVLWKSKTDNKGIAELWASMKANKSGGQFYISINNQIFNNIITFSKGINKLTINNNNILTNKKADIAFMVDATGSMGDELNYLKAELVDIISRVKENQSGASINTGAVFYRDTEDEYITKKFDFTDDISKTISFIKAQYASGGGDFPEAVHTAMNVSIKELQWSDNAQTKLLFMVLDAPPHYDSQIISQINSLVYLASSKGIKLIPITASGIDKETEFLMRYMAIATNGTYVFITNHSGIGNDHLEPSIGQYEVEYLNELMVRLINEYME